VQAGRIARARPLAGAPVIAALLAAPGHAAPPLDGGAAVAFQVATRLPRPTFADDWLRKPNVTMSEGWACAAFESEVGRIHQCWDAGPHPRAFTVPWMKDRIDVARDRWCEHDVQAMTFRCWQRPRRGDPGPRELPPAWEWMYGRNAGSNQVIKSSVALEDVIMGGTFACLRTSPGQGVFCLGDDRFGQLGSSAPPRPQAGPGDPAFVRGLGREVKPAAGTWHACALADPGGPTATEQIPVVCWGRGDHGQLGARAPDWCTVDGKTVACARTPVRGPRVKDQMVVLGAGDLFTCVTSESGTQCWGASRDGLFGVRGSCPESLRRAWPTPDGPGPAPNASCTTKAVTLPGATKFDPYFEVAPREIRYRGHVLSSVPAPRDPKLGRAFVSPGSDASWCAVRGDGVVCWGEKYSPPGAPAKPVPIAFEPRPSLGDLAVIDGPPATAAKTKCQIQRPCPHPVQTLPPCAGDNDPGRPVAEILAKTKSLSGGIVRVRGALGVGALHPIRYGTSDSNTTCDSAVSCCRRLETFALVGSPEGALALEYLGCVGDESRACCNAPAYGQSVIATGVLVRQQEERMQAGWRLVNATVCEVRKGR
jgi:hypothetical protein